MTPPEPPLTRVAWPYAYRIIRSRFPPIDLFEDIADPADWEALASAEAKTNPRVMESVGNLDLVPVHRRVSGPGATWVMAPFVHVAPDRPSRFADGTYGVLYAGDRFEVAVFETAYHHGRFMAATNEPPGWTSGFRELVTRVDAELHDVRGDPRFADCLDRHSYAAAHALARRLRTQGAEGIVYPSVRNPDGDAIAAFWPDVVDLPVQGRHLTYHWDGARVDRIHDATNGTVYALR